MITLRGDSARPPAPPLSPEEAATVARFEAAEAAPESFNVIAYLHEVAVRPQPLSEVPRD